MADYLKIPELARRIDVSEQTARRMVRSGKLPSSFVGGAYRVNEDDLEDYLQQAKVTPNPKVPALFSLEWARAAEDIEFYREVEAAPEESTESLNRLFAALHRAVSRPLARELARRNGREVAGDPGPDLAPGEWGMLRARRDAVKLELDRRRPPVARIKTWAPWIGRTAEVRWLVPEEEWHLHRERVEELLEGEEYVDVRAEDVEEESAEPEVELYASAG